jgi:formate/nitrite transporter FocA (FNT family)
MKYLILALLAAIIISLGTGLFYLRGEHADSAKMLRALKFRVGLSLVLIIVLVAAYFLGWINAPSR